MLVFLCLLFSQKRILNIKKLATEDTEFFNWFYFLFLCALCVSAANILIFKTSASGQKKPYLHQHQIISVNQFNLIHITQNTFDLTAGFAHNFGRFQGIVVDQSTGDFSTVGG